VPFNRLRESQQERILGMAEVVELRPGEELFRQGSQDSFTYYLLDGSLVLNADGVRAKKVAADTDAAKSPLGHLQPRRLSAVAETGVSVLKVRSALIERVLAPRPDDAENPNAYDDISNADEAMNPALMAAALKPELFGKLPPANMQRLFNVMEWVKYKAGDNVIRQGDVGDYYYIIKEGSCEVRRTTSVSTHGIKLAELKPGDAFGEDALISNMRRNATVRMITDGELIRVGKDDFNQLIKDPLLRFVSFEAASEKVRDGAVWLDVRFPEECRNGALPGSMNIPLNMLRMYAGKLDPAKPYITYCDDGSRSSVAAFILRERGFEAACVEGGCGAQLAALYALHAPGSDNPDLTATVIPRPLGQTEGQETVPMEEETLRILDHLASLQLFSGSTDKAMVLDKPHMPFEANAATQAANQLAMPILMGRDPSETRPQLPPAIAAADVDGDATIVSYEEIPAEEQGAPPPAIDPLALQAAEIRVRDLEAQLRYERESAERLGRALRDAELQLAKQAEAESSAVARAAEGATDQAAAAERERLAQVHQEALSSAVAAERERLERSYRDQLEAGLAAEREHAQQANQRAIETAVAAERERLESAQRASAEETLEQERARLKQQHAAELAAALDAERARLEQAHRRQLEEMQARLAENVALLERTGEQLRNYETALQQGSAVSAERDQLEQSYRQRIEELEKLLAAQSEAEELLSADRQKLTGELAEQRRLLEEAKRQLKETPAQAQQLEQATEAQLSELRKILGAEFARNAALVELARQERSSAEAARKRLVEQTEQVFSEYRGRHERVRIQEEERVREERRLMEMERNFLRSAMDAANRVREQAEQMIRQAEEQATRLRALTSTQIDAIESEARIDMKRMQASLPWLREDGRPDPLSDAEVRLGQEISHQVDDMLTAKAPAQVVSAKILELQRQDMERIQKRTEEVKIVQSGGMELIRGGLSDMDESSSSSSSAD
jgi:CRP-like cAMP-binding protein